jgi:SPP1 gp7 family putative phage head morphogenesis protein
VSGRLQQVIAQYRQQLLHHEAQAQASLNSAHAHTVAKIQPHIDKLTKQIGEAQDSGQPVPPHWLYEQNRLKTTKDLISGHIDQYATLARGTTIGLKKKGVQLGEQSGMAQLDATMPESTPHSFGVPSDQAIASIVGSTQKGSPLADLFDGFGAEAADRVGKILITAVSLGDNPRKIARDIADALDISRSRALTIARTEMLRAYREAALETYRANDDVVEGWLWMSALDAKTCCICIAMHGTVHDLSEDLNGHPNCRCTKSPRVKGSNFSPLLGSDWFDDQSEAVQRQILGSNAAYEAYNSGASLSDFVGINHDKDWGSSVYQKSAKDVAS